jgi:Zn ribbon nucleic-acid-binding protein
MTANDTNLVPAEDACPACGERDSDRLVWIDDDVVQCARCGATYTPGMRKEHNDEQP